MKKLFISDMDGTLLNNNKELPDRFPEMLAALKEDGSYFSFASGRSYMGLNGMFGHYSDDFGYICDNGGMVVFHDQVLKAETLSGANLAEIIELLQINSKLVMAFCGTKTVYVMHREPMDDDQIRELSYYYPIYSIVHSIDEIKDDILKVALLYNDHIEENILPYIHLDSSMVHPVTAYNWIDVFRAGVSKGEGIAALQKHLGIEPKDTYVFGDYYNDLSMVDYSDHSFAMGNAIPEVQEHFRHVIGTNEDGAVAETILKILHGDVK